MTAQTDTKLPEWPERGIVDPTDHGLGAVRYERARANTTAAILRIQREKNRELRRLLRFQSRTNHQVSVT